MSTGAGWSAGAAGVRAAVAYFDELPGLEGGDASIGAGSGSGNLPFIIEVSDKDYRSFCFPCHALEEATACNAGI